MSFFPARSLHAAPIAFFFFFTSVTAQPLEPVLAQARAQKGPLLDTLKELVSIESGSRDLEGLERIAQLIAGRLKSLGGEVELVEPADLYRMDDTPERVGRMVRATFKGKGAKRILERSAGADRERGRRGRAGGARRPLQDGRHAGARRQDGARDVQGQRREAHPVEVGGL